MLPTKVTYDHMLTTWSQQLNPVVANPILSGQQLKNVLLINGTTQVNHGLQRTLQGWFIVRQRSAAAIHDNQDNNTMQSLTLTLVSNAAVSVDIWVY